MSRLSLLVLWPPSQEREEFLAAVGADGMEVVDSPGALEGRQGEGWGILLLGPTLSPEEILGVLWRERSKATPWATFLVRREGEEWRLWPLAFGPSLSLEALATTAGAPEEAGPLPDVNWILRGLGKIAHDTNNALTAGLTEVQLLLMEADDPDRTNSLQLIERQFRRLRALAGDLSRIRAYGKASGGS